MKNPVVYDDLTLPKTDLKGRLQRRLRHDRKSATRHVIIGTVVTSLVLVVTGIEVGPFGRAGAEAQPDRVQPVGAPDPDAAFTATFVGDLMFARHLETVMERYGDDAPLKHVEHLLEGDYVSGNLEQVLSDDDDLPDADKLIHLQSPTHVADVLADAGFTTLSLANNHAMDHGIPGLADTIDALDDAGLRHAGGGIDLDQAMEIDYQTHGDLTVATLSFTDVFVEGFIARAFQGGVLQAETDVFGPLIQEADRQADVVITHFHFGEEYDFAPSNRQREIAELAAQAGADVVVGHHPHVLLPAERIGDTLVFYSLGNFVFDQGWSRTRESALARYTLSDEGRVRLELVPVYIREGTPKVLDGAHEFFRRQRIFSRLRGDGLEWNVEDRVLVTEFDVAVGDQ